MKVRVEIPPGKDHHFDRGMTVGRILQELQLNPESVIVMGRGALLTPDDWVGVEEEITIRGVISGG